jgi:hypothetical protein
MYIYVLLFLSRAHNPIKPCTLLPDLIFKVTSNRIQQPPHVPSFHLSSSDILRRLSSCIRGLVSNSDELVGDGKEQVRDDGSWAPRGKNRAESLQSYLIQVV